MKKTITLIIIIFLATTMFAGCGNSSENGLNTAAGENTDDRATLAPESEPTQKPTAIPTEKPTSKPTEAPTPEPLPTIPAAEEPTSMKGFIKADGTLLKDGEGENFLIKGMAFGNNVWANPVSPPKTHHTEESYKKLSELGFNSIRFYLNYGLFESDYKPYEYKKEGWEWLDWNIRMARRYNMRLILNMHYPQGGFQSQGDGMNLWTDEENQKRLVALWTEIAARYKDEIAIAAFDFVNEPNVPEKSTLEETFAQWQNLAQKIAYSIRKVDTNHMIIVERLNAYKNIETGSSNWDTDMNGQMNFFLIDDPNVAYEFHTYDPFVFTHQNASWVDSSRGVFSVYPDENAVTAVGNQPWVGAVFTNPKLSRAKTDWQELKGVKFKVEDERYKIGVAAVQVQNIGKDGIVWIDDVVVNEYDENGNFVREIVTFGFDTNPGWGYWSADESGKLSYAAEEGHDKAGCLTVSGTTSDANTNNGLKRFIVKQGYHYEISGWMKGRDIGSSSTVTFRVDFMDAEEVNTINKEYLEKSFTRFLKFGTDNNVPLYLGEFGVIVYGFEEDRGGDRWIEDALDICKRYNINFNYHTYHEEAFGLYTNNAGQYPDKLNKALYEAFKEALKD